MLGVPICTLAMCQCTRMIHMPGVINHNNNHNDLVNDYTRYNLN